MKLTNYFLLYNFFALFKIICTKVRDGSKRIVRLKV